jgi:hypothetical protein
MASSVYGKSSRNIWEWLIKSKYRISKDIRVRKAGRQTDPPTGGVKKTLQLLPITVTEKKEVIKVMADTYDIKMLCGLMDMPRSSYYYVPDKRDNMEIRDSIEHACLNISGMGIEE